jgi:hypothetical protein
MEASILCFLEPGYDTGGAAALHGLMDKGQCGLQVWSVKEKE